MCHRSLAVTDLATLIAKTVFTAKVCRGAAVELAGVSLLQHHPTERLRCEALLGCLGTKGSLAEIFADAGLCSAPGATNYLKKQFLKLCLEEGALRHDPVPRLRLDRKYCNPIRMKWKSNSKPVVHFFL